MSSKVILVTGANRGIGLSIVQLLAQRAPTATLLVASRAKQSAEEAIAKLKETGLQADFRPIALDITSDNSIAEAVRDVERSFGKLDVLVNNAGIAGTTSPDNSELRADYNQILDTNVTSVAIISTLFIPLLQKSDNPRVVNVSSGRGSIGRVTSGTNPPTSKIPYSVSKVALNLLTIEMSHANKGFEFQAVNPGHCKTGFNGFRGAKDPAVGAVSAVELALAEKGSYESGFWEFEEGKMRKVPW